MIALCIPLCRAADPDSPERVRALIEALGSNDADLVDRVQDELVEIGRPAEMALQDALPKASARTRERIEATLGELAEQKLEKDFEQIAKCDDSQVDLLHGALLVARVEFPSLKEEAFRRRFDVMAAEIKSNLSEHSTPKEKLLALLDYLFVQQGFGGDEKEYYHPRNSCLNKVLERRQGIPITLSVLMMEVGRRIGVPLAGIGLPGHFVVRAEVEGEPWYLDAFNGASV